MTGNCAGGACAGVTGVVIGLVIATGVGVRGNAGGTTGRATVS